MWVHPTLTQVLRIAICVNEKMANLHTLDFRQTERGDVFFVECIRSLSEFQTDPKKETFTEAFKFPEFM
jgi:hypothetical protein